VPGALPDETVDLLETLAGQSVLAIHNAQVFQELERKTRELEVVSEHKSEFLASMSHELRTPLNAVIGFSDVLLDRMFGELNERQDEYVRDIRDSGRHLLELLNEILDLSKIEAGRMELDRQAVPLPPLLEHCVTMVRERAQEHGIALTLDVSDEVGIVSADNLRVKQVILNLLTNAVKFTPDGGAVTVGAHRDRDDVVVTVRDTGIGIAESQQERIFDAFQQGGRTPSSAEGTGLGLTLTKRMVELHGGRIRVDSRPGEGSTFTVVLPVGEPVPEAPELAPKPADELAGPPVLVIEDDRHSLDLLTLYLRSAGFAVASAREGDVGLAMARRLRPAAVVLDILLPNIDGWSLLGRLKSDDATADIPVIIVSMLDERGRGFALGAADYLVKPVGRNEVLAAVGRCAPVPTAGRRVVVIDDDETSCSLVRAVLEQAGYEVRCAGGGEEGVQLVCDTRPDVVLLDLLMPHVDGFEVIDRIRADPATAEVPIVVLSAKTMTSGDIERLRGQISFLARKGDTDAAGLAELVRRAADGPRTVEETWQAS
jgi:DNA-binding response OmpR family regulator/nitrogen-specific signal transduction histidine kinase